MVKIYNNCWQWYKARKTVNEINIQYIRLGMEELETIWWDVYQLRWFGHIMTMGEERTYLWEMGIQKESMEQWDSWHTKKERTLLNTSFKGN